MAGAGDVPGRKKKVESEKDVEFAEGGDTPMFGKGDRTVTDTGDAANPQAIILLIRSSTASPGNVCLTNKA